MTNHLITYTESDDRDVHVFRVAGPDGYVEYVFLTNTLLAAPAGYQPETLAVQHAEEARAAVVLGTDGAIELVLRRWYGDLGRVGATVLPADQHTAGTVFVSDGFTLVRRFPADTDEDLPWLVEFGDEAIPCSDADMDQIIADGAVLVTTGEQTRVRA